MGWTVNCMRKHVAQRSVWCIHAPLVDFNAISAYKCTEWTVGRINLLINLVFSEDLLAVSCFL